MADSSEEATKWEQGSHISRTDVDRVKVFMAGQQLAGKRPRKLVVLERQSSEGGEARGAPTRREGPRNIEVVQ